MCMHIGFDAKRFFNNPTGLGNYARSTVFGLAEHFPEHRYTLYAQRLSGPFCTLPACHGLHVHEACPIGRMFPALWRSLGIPREARTHDLDIYHGLSHELPLTSFGPRTRTVVSMHDLLFLTHPHLYPWIDRQLYAFKYRKSCLHADMIVAISRKTADDVHEIFKIPRERIRVAYQSCSPAFSVVRGQDELDRLRRAHDLPQRYVLFVGSLIPRKGAQTLISALALLPSAERPDLVIVGKGPLESALRDQARAAGLLGRVHFLGQVADADLPGLYQLAEAFAYPSVGEGFGIPILEALSSGIPVITSTGSCFAEPGGDAALYTTPGDVPELAQALAKVLGDSTLRQEMIARGVLHAQNFHISRTSAALMQVYADLCAQR
ncbi:MAG: glycosyltransferase family 1 protein [Deltaproteobacteria bacterium HGW-Deltaproteobacteria-18]|nr:MAG: glycosyltransferase family 1 protein [Deltaproteobacteria bacterium HGW-Deltaproteobacteria-18]